MPRGAFDLATVKFLNVSSDQYKKGMDTYGRPLAPFNGRDAFRDAWEELVDLANYMAQIEMEFSNVAIYLYVFSQIEKFDHLIPKDIMLRLQQVVGSETVDSLKIRMGIVTDANESNNAEIN